MKKAMLAIAMALALAMCIGQVPAFAASTLTWPVPASKSLSQGYHNGNAIDVKGSQGTTIVAAMNGKVTKVCKCTKQHHGSSGDCNGFGTGLVILGDDGRAYQYAHMNPGSIPSGIKVGSYVKAGQKIGCMGKTGNASGVHLHFGISYNKDYWKSGPNPAHENYRDVPKTLSIGKLSASNITKTNAKLKATVSKSFNTYVTSCGIYLGTSKSNMTKRNTEKLGAGTNNANKGSGFNAWYNLTSELGIKLKPNTTYYYKFYCVSGGKTYTSGIGSFKTAK